MEYEYIENNRDKYLGTKQKSQLKLIKKLRNVKLTKDDTELFGEEKKKIGSKNKIDKIMDIDDELIMSNKYYK